MDVGLRGGWPDGMYRLRGLWLLTVLGLGCILAGSAPIFLEGSSLQPGRFVVAMAFAVICPLVLISAARSGVRLTPGGVRVRNFFHSVFIPWSEVAAFDLVISRQVVMRRRDGSMVPCAGMPHFLHTTPTKIGPSSLRALLDGLNARVSTEQRRLGSQRTVPPVEISVKITRDKQRVRLVAIGSL